MICGKITPQNDKSSHGLHPGVRAKIENNIEHVQNLNVQIGENILNRLFDISTHPCRQYK